MHQQPGEDEGGGGEEGSQHTGQSVAEQPEHDTGDGTRALQIYRYIQIPSNVERSVETGYKYYFRTSPPEYRNS